MSRFATTISRSFRLSLLARSTPATRLRSPATPRSYSTSSEPPSETSQGGCGTFYAISIQHESFKGLSTIKQHRIVNDLLADEIKGMHGLQLKTSPPQ